LFLDSLMITRAIVSFEDMQL